MSLRKADPSKIVAARSYFERKFPGWTIQEDHDIDTLSEVFTIEGGPSGQVFKIKLARAFLDDHEAQDIARKLEHWQVGDFLKLSGSSPLLVTSNGIHT